MLIYHRSLAIALFLGCTAATPALSHDETHGWKDETRSPKIVDARGRFVGLPGLLRQSQGAWYKLDLNLSGFNSADSAPLVYPSTNCSGQAYVQVVGIPAYGTFVSAPVQPSAGYVTNGVVYFPGLPYTTILMRSERRVTATSQGVCALIEYDARMLVGPALKETFTGFVGPFLLK